MTMHSLIEHPSEDTKDNNAAAHIHAAVNYYDLS